MRLRCYCCGESLANESWLMLVANAVEGEDPEVDRVFVVKESHIKRLVGVQTINVLINE